MKSELYLRTSFSQSIVFGPLKWTYREQKISGLFWLIPYGLLSRPWSRKDNGFESFKPLMIDWQFWKAYIYHHYSSTISTPKSSNKYNTFQRYLFRSLYNNLITALDSTGRSRTNVNNILEQYLFKLHLKAVLLRNVFWSFSHRL